MKITGIILQRNEIDVILFNVLYHLRSVGFDELIVGDNGSSDGSKEALEHLAKRDPRLKILDMKGKGWQQSAHLTTMYKKAVAAGADWVCPLDADEFLPINRRSLEQVLKNTKQAAVHLRIRNFVQNRKVTSRRMHGIASMLHIAQPIGSSGEAYDLVTSGQIGFVEMTYPPKWIWRANTNLVIGNGNHGANIDLQGISKSIVLNHIPLRSKIAIVQKAQHVKRIQSKDPRTSWHIRRWIDVDLDEEWARNSTKGAAVDVNGERHRLRFDPFFLKVFVKYAFTVRGLVRNSRKNVG